MNPYRPYRLSAVPRTLHAQLEIANAIRALAGPDEDELLRKRRAEIVAIRRDLDALVRDVRKLGEELPALAKAELLAALKKYSPDLPRVPEGNSKGGQWTAEGSADDTDKESDSKRPDALTVDGQVETRTPSGKQTEITVAARSSQAASDCDAQYAADIVLCRMVRTPTVPRASHGSHAACLAGRPLPPLRF
jgi:hypothetical protein